MYETCATNHKYIGITIEGYYSDAFKIQFPSVHTIPFEENLLPYTVSVLYHDDNIMRNIIGDISMEMKHFLDKL